MRDGGVEKLTPPRAGAILALLAGFLLAPSEVRAGCHIGHDPGESPEGISARLEGLVGAGAIASTRPADPLRQPGRCLSCSRAPESPIAPPGTIVLRPDQWACLPALAGDDDTSSEALRADGAPRPPVLLGLAVFHPPRPFLP